MATTNESPRKTAGIGRRERGADQALDRGVAFVRVRFGGHSIILDYRGVAFFSEIGILLVSDLHLEKGSRAAERGRLIPRLDSHDTLLRLRNAIEHYRPRRVICLGDSFQDGRAGDRMMEADRAALLSICALAEQWTWIGGNHDPEAPAFCGGERRDEVELEGMVLRHQPRSGSGLPQAVGHFHPKVSVGRDGHRFSGRCFCLSDEVMIMPAFGAYAGGLSVNDPALRGLHTSDPRVFMLHRSKIWRIA